jgi:hypothetical protein
MLLQQTGNLGGYDAWEKKNKEGGRCGSLHLPRKKVSLFIFQTQFETFYNFRPMVLEKNSKKTQTC